MSQVSLYRKYRSQTFADLIGQNHVVRTLQNGIASGRISHSYLFTGPRGTGKTSTARLMAKALCCEHGPSAEPDNTCEICRAITNGSCVDVIEMDAASESGVDQVRDQIIEVVDYLPMMCRYKVFIIDEVHDLSAKAFDALLKTIEEPPPHIIFILATTEYNKVPATIRSRCQKFEFHRAGMQDLVDRLSFVAEAEGVSIEPAALTTIARMADGGFRDALTLLEQAIVTADGAITVDHVYDQLGLVAEEVVDGLLMGIKTADVGEIMRLLAEVTQLGRDPRAVLESMMLRMSDLTRASYQVDTGADATTEASRHEAAAQIGRDTLLRLRGEVAEIHKEIRDISLPRLWLEAEFVRLAIEAQAAPKPRTAPEPVKAVAAEPTPRKPKPAEEEVPKETPAPPKKEPAPKGVPSDFWEGVLAELRKVSKTLGMKLVGTRIAEERPDAIVIEFSLESFYDWVREKPAAVAEIRRVVHAAKGQEIAVEFRLTKPESNGHIDHEAVELPAEGQRLEQLAKDVFGV